VPYGSFSSIPQNASFETPVFNNYSNNYNKQQQYSSFEKNVQSTSKSAMNFNANSSLFNKKNFENDLKFQMEGCSTNPNYYNFNYKLLNTQSPVYYPPGFSNIYGNQNVNCQQSSSEITFEEESNKFIAIYDVQIENDEKFKVTKRIIGLKGNNMKKIINTCKIQFPYINSNDLLKIRLRGKGSGYKEGANNLGILLVYS
jgi:hypothetical protein